MVLESHMKLCMIELHFFKKKKKKKKKEVPPNNEQFDH